MSLEEAYKKAKIEEKKRKMIDTCIKNRICPECGNKSVVSAGKTSSGLEKFVCNRITGTCNWSICR